MTCRRHGIVVCAVPWARHTSRFTRAFEDQTAWLAVNTSQRTMVLETCVLGLVNERTSGPEALDARAPYGEDDSALSAPGTHAPGGVYRRPDGRRSGDPRPSRSKLDFCSASIRSASRKLADDLLGVRLASCAASWPAHAKMREQARVGYKTWALCVNRLVRPHRATTDDRVLLRASRDGRGGFDAFYRRHRNAVLAFDARRVAEPELAADLTAETFAAALLAVQDRDRRLPEAPLAWLAERACERGRRCAPSSRPEPAGLQALRRAAIPNPRSVGQNLDVSLGPLHSGLLARSGGLPDGEENCAGVAELIGIDL